WTSGSSAERSPAGRATATSTFVDLDCARLSSRIARKSSGLYCGLSKELRGGAKTRRRLSRWVTPPSASFGSSQVRTLPESFRSRRVGAPPRCSFEVLRGASPRSFLFERLSRRGGREPQLEQHHLEMEAPISPSRVRRIIRRDPHRFRQRRGTDPPADLGERPGGGAV